MLKGGCDPYRCGRPRYQGPCFGDGRDLSCRSSDGLFFPATGIGRGNNPLDYGRESWTGCDDVDLYLT